VEGSVNVPEDHLVSVRIGDVRRQAPLAKLRRQHLKFPSAPGSVVEPLRIEVYRPIAAARVVVQSQDRRYNVPLAGKSLAAGATMELGFRICAQNSSADETRNTMAATGDSFPLQAGSTAGMHSGKMQFSSTKLLSEKESPDKYGETAQAARRYLDSKGVMRYVQALLHAVIQERPEDPYDYMRRQMQVVCEQRDDTAGELETTQLLPATEEPKETDHQILNASQNGDLEKTREGLNERHMTSDQPSRRVQETDGRQPMEHKAGAQQPEMQQDSEKQQEALQVQQQQQVLDTNAPQKLVVEQTIAGQQPTKESPAVTIPPATGPTQQEEEEEKPEGGLEEEQAQTEDAAFEEARRICQVTFYEACDKGELAEVLRRVLGKAEPENQISCAEAPPAPSHPDPLGPPPLGPEIHTPLGWPTPPGGPMPMRPPTPKGLPPTLPSVSMGMLSEEEVEQTRIRLQSVLQLALQSGTLNTTFREFLACESSGHGPFVSGRTPFASKADDHKLATDLDNSDAVQAKERMRKTMEQGLQDGRLDSVIDRFCKDRVHRLANPKSSAARDKMTQVLETAVTNGSLDAALDAVFGHGNVVGVEQPDAVGAGEPNILGAEATGALPDRLEDTRKQLHSDLQSATQTGKLQEAVRATREQHVVSDQASLDVQIARELREGFAKACRDGQLEEMCRKFLQTPRNDSTQEQTKNHLGDALASDKFECALGNQQTKHASAVEQASRADSRLLRPLGQPETQPLVRQNHPQDIVSVRTQLENLKTENVRLREKVDMLEKIMQQAEEKRGAEGTPVSSSTN